MSNVPLREFRFEIKGTLLGDKEEKTEELLKERFLWALRDWVKEVDSVEIFPVYNG